MRLDELLVELVDELLQLVIGELDVEDERPVRLEAGVVQVDAADAQGAAEDREDLARFGADGALEAGGFHGPRLYRVRSRPRPTLRHRFLAHVGVARPRLARIQRAR